MPKSWSAGALALRLPYGVTLDTSKCCDERVGDVIRLFHRYIKEEHLSHGEERGVPIHVSVAEPSLHMGGPTSDEAYELRVFSPEADHKFGCIEIHAKTIFGAIAGFTTLGQLTANHEIPNAPWTIEDEPRYAHRGLMVDTARHFLPFKMLLEIVDDISAAKMNALHLHLTDATSFPIELISPLAKQLSEKGRWCSPCAAPLCIPPPPPPPNPPPPPPPHPPPPPPPPPLPHTLSSSCLSDMPTSTTRSPR